jgi:hypothetical protein
MVFDLVSLDATIPLGKTATCDASPHTSQMQESPIFGAATMRLGCEVLTTTFAVVSGSMAGAAA